MSNKILLAEDDYKMRRLVKDFLTREGYEVLEAQDGKEALMIFQRESTINCCILDIMMPEMDGWELCKNIRKSSNVPILILTAKGEEYDELYGLQLGADDYVSKPFSPLILVARVKSLLKRNNITETSNDESVWNKKGIHINFLSHKVMIDGGIVELSPREYDLLVYFVKNESIVLSRDTLLEKVWGYDYFGDARTVDTHINRLRIKLSPYEGSIQTVRGSGYRFEVEA